MEKENFNAYKKRECERKRRFRLKNKLNHICFSKYRCEVCRKYYDILFLLYGFNICEHCLNIEKMENFFIRKNKKEYITEHLEDDINNKKRELLETKTQNKIEKDEVSKKLSEYEYAAAQNEIIRNQMSGEFLKKYPEMHPDNLRVKEWFEYDETFSIQVNRYGKMVSVCGIISRRI